MKRNRRALVFTVPQGRELHYLAFHGEYLGRRWAPFFHAYGYYLPKINVPISDEDHVDHVLKEQSKSALKTNGKLLILLLLALGRNRALIGLIGGILWAEMESGFAYWDGHVTFGSSHVISHSCGYGIVSMMLQKKLTIWMLPFLIYSVPLFYEFVGWWKRDGFGVVGSARGYQHRTDHLAHIGGIVAGGITALLTKNKRLI